MKIIITTSLDQDVGLEAMQAACKSNLPIDQFAAELVSDFLDNLQPRLAVQSREVLKRAIDLATDEKLAAVSAELAKV